MKTMIFSTMMFTALILAPTQASAGPKNVFSIGFLRTDSSGIQCFVGVGYRPDQNNVVRMVYRGPMPNKILTPAQHEIMKTCSQTRNHHITLSKHSNTKKDMLGTVAVRVQCESSEETRTKTSQEVFNTLLNNWAKHVNASDFKNCP